MAVYTIRVVDTDATFRCSDERNVLEAMERLGKRGVMVGCRGGGCGVCKVEVVSGTYERELMSSDHVTPEDLAANRVLACKIRPTSDLVIRNLGLTKKSVSKEAAA
jgi:ferredoxin